MPVAAAVTVVLVNLPFALAGYEGWRASFTFQELRKVDLTTNSIWYWGFRPESDPDNLDFQATMDWLSPGLVLLSFAVAVAVGWWRWRRDGVYPWIGVSAAMLCGFLLLHKVHSPQYTLWLLPFFVLLQVPWRWVVGYLLVDLVMGIGIFRWFYALKTGVGVGIYEGFAAQAVVDRRVGAGGAAGGAVRGVPAHPRPARGRAAPAAHAARRDGAGTSWSRYPALAPGEDRLFEVRDPRGPAVQHHLAELVEHRPGRRVHEAAEQRQLDHRRVRLGDRRRTAARRRAAPAARGAARRPRPGWAAAAGRRRPTAPPG